MKINLSKHDIIGRSKKDLQDSGNLEFVGLKEISLAYVNTEETTKVPSVSIKDGFSESSRRYVRPYDSFNDEDTYIFDKNNEIVQVSMKRVGDTYYYEPKNQTEYTPLSFKVSLDIQKQEQYFNDKNYNIKVSAIETSENQEFVNKLISIFADKYIYGNCPSNVRINGGAKSELSLIEQDYRTADFVFIESSDGVHLGSSDSEGDIIDLDYILENHTNIWLSVDNYEDRIKVISATGALSTLHMNSTVIYDTTDYTITRSQMEVWNQDIDFIEGPDSVNFTYEYLNEAILLIHKIGKGFIIITPRWFLNNLAETGLMVYETMMKCYLQQYCRSKETTMWITDEPVDYLSYHEDKFNRSHKIVTIDELMLGHDFDYNNYRLINVITDTANVSFIGINENHELLFVKIGGESDPIKQINEQSFYTTKHTVINYAQEDISLVEVPLEIEVTVSNSAAYLTVQPIVSSSHKLFTKDVQTFRITDFTTQYGLYVDKGSSSISNTFCLIDRKEVPPSGLTQVATVRFDFTSRVVACDTRIPGGGLPDGQPDDYDMLDIGHINGRPYRLGSTFIIRVPKKLSNYESRIRTELDKHIAAGDEYVLVFE